MNLRNHILTFYLLCFALVLASCSKQESVQDQFDKKLVIGATLEVGHLISDIHASTLVGESAEQDISGLEIAIHRGDQTIYLSEDLIKKGYYHGPADFIISPGEEYELRLDYQDQAIRAISTSPPAMEVLEASKEFIEADLQGDLVFLEWSPVNTGSFNEYFYVIELIPLDDDPEMIMRFSEEESKTTVVSYVAEATLSVNDFNFYGNHLIKIYAISKTYEQLFLPQTDLTDNGPTNIEGAFGYFIAASSIQTSLEIR